MLSITVRPQFLAAIRDRCRARDEPMTVWCRRVLEKALHDSNEP